MQKNQITPPDFSLSEKSKKKKKIMNPGLKKIFFRQYYKEIQKTG